MVTSKDEMLTELRGHFIAGRGDSLQFQDDDDLFLSGVLDSLGIASLLGFIDQRFDVQIGLDEVTVENFSSLNLIADHVESKLSK